MITDNDGDDEDDCDNNANDDDNDDDKLQTTTYPFSPYPALLFRLLSFHLVIIFV